MAWIESHQEIAHHPKTRKLARRLDISIPTAVGHLHCLWHWALSYAEDGDLSKFDNDDVAIAAMWEGDPRMFVEALIDSRLVDDEEEVRELHDWWDYAGKLVERRKANVQRMRDARATNVPRTHHERAEEPRERAGATNPTQPTVPNPTEPDLTNLVEDANSPDKPARPKRAIKISEDWWPDDDLLAWGATEFPNVDLNEQTEMFKDHFGANGKPMKDWRKAWRNWIRRTKDFSRPPMPNGKSALQQDERPAPYQDFELGKYDSDETEEERKATLEKIREMSGNIGQMP